MTLGQYIQQERLNQHMSQGDLAALLNVSPDTVGDWERDVTMPTLRSFAALCFHLNVDPHTPLALVNVTFTRPRPTPPS